MKKKLQAKKKPLKKKVSKPKEEVYDDEEDWQAEVVGCGEMPLEIVIKIFKWKQRKEFADYMIKTLYHYYN